MVLFDGTGPALVDSNLYLGNRLEGDTYYSHRILKQYHLAEQPLEIIKALIEGWDMGWVEANEHARFLLRNSEELIVDEHKLLPLKSAIESELQKYFHFVPDPQEQVDMWLAAAGWFYDITVSSLDKLLFRCNLVLGDQLRLLIAPEHITEQMRRMEKDYSALKP